MIKQNKFLRLKNISFFLIIGLVTSTLLTINVNANDRKRIYSLSVIKAKAVIINNLTSKLRKDLFNPDINFQFRNVKKHKIINGKTLVEGDGFCVLTKSKDKIPLEFELVIDSDSRKVSKIEYEFVDVEEIGGDAPDDIENKLMSVLLKQIGRDFKTQNVVITINATKSILRSNAPKTYVGYGDVQIKSGEWKKVEFTMEINLNDSTAENVVYEIK